MADIARKAGVSKNTVSLALRHDARIPPATRNRIASLAAKMGYRANPTVARLMAELRLVRTPAFKATLALFNANNDARAFSRHPTIPSYVEGCRRRAAQLGYALDEFWLHSEDWKRDSLNRVLKSRNIQGAVIVGTMTDNHLPAKFLSTCRQFPCVVTGVRTHNPTLSFACVDHHALALQAVEHALRLGYRRPALVLDSVIDELVEGRFSAGVFVAQQRLPAGDRTKPFLMLDEARRDLSCFEAWLDEERPDVILTLYNVVRHWVEALGRKVPRDIGMIQLEWRRQQPEWAGMNQHNDLVGEAAVDMLVGMLHRGEKGVPVSARATLIDSTWVDGNTVKRR
jgi:LacI family transcriptional regulator